MNDSSDSDSIKNTQILFGEEARKRLFEGISIVSKAVGVTMGPKGKTVVIQRPNDSPILTKDGVTVSQSVKLKDPVQRLGADLIVEAASQTNDVAGDGTTTSTVLSYALIAESLRLLAAGFSANDLKAGMEWACEGVIANLKAAAKPIDTMESVAQIGTISANGDRQIGDLLAQAMERVGMDGVITVEDAKGTQTSCSVVEGMQVDRGYFSPYFVNNREKMAAIYEDVRVVLTDQKISQFEDIRPLLEAIARIQKPVLLIAEEIEGAALQGLVLNRQQANLPIVAVRTPAFAALRDQFLSDLAVLSGAKIISLSQNMTLAKITPNDWGQLKSIYVDSKTSTFVGKGNTKEAVNSHVEKLRAQYVQDVTLGQREKEVLRVRIARLASGVAVIKIGGNTEVEMIERKYRIEDALHATRAAVEEGIVPGGGLALYRAAKSVAAANLPEQSDGFLAGVRLLIKGCFYPMEQILNNAGHSATVIKNALETEDKPDTWGFDARKGQWCDLIQDGIIDPVKVTRSALTNAVSVAGAFLMLEAVVAEEQL